METDSPQRVTGGNLALLLIAFAIRIHLVDEADNREDGAVCPAAGAQHRWHSGQRAVHHGPTRADELNLLAASYDLLTIGGSVSQFLVDGDVAEASFALNA